VSGWVVALVTAGLIVASAFFVVIEFSLLGARRHRLEEQAATSASARAALRGMNELTIMLAGAQLGITACTFALGAITKPAVEYALVPVLEATGMPTWLAGGASFALSLLVVTFLHLVVGEMAPKSWAIAHPELSARTVSLPARGFIWVFRPLLLWINGIANRLVARTGAEPVDQAAVGGQDAATIRQLVEHSAQLGVLETEFSAQIDEAIALETLTVRELVRADETPTSVPADATVAQVRAVALESGHLRILVRDAGGPALGVVHVRDVLLEEGDRPAAEHRRDLLALDGSLPVHEALERMRATSTQLAVVTAQEGLLGVVTMSDVLRRLLHRPTGAGAATAPA
jgi:CBS domain containing-hemolysin-like protein